MNPADPTPEKFPTPEATPSPHSDAPPMSVVPAPHVIAADLLEILVCPLTRSRLVQDGDWLIAQRPTDAGLRYPIRGGIPQLLVDDAALPVGCANLAEFKARFADDIPESMR